MQQKKTLRNKTFILQKLSIGFNRHGGLDSRDRYRDLTQIKSRQSRQIDTETWPGLSLDSRFFLDGLGFKSWNFSKHLHCQSRLHQDQEQVKNCQIFSKLFLLVLICLKQIKRTPVPKTVSFGQKSWSRQV